MTGEAFTLRHFALQRHDSMYLLLPVVMVFLYRLLLAWSPQAPAFCRPGVHLGVYPAPGHDCGHPGGR